MEITIIAADFGDVDIGATCLIISGLFFYWKTNDSSIFAEIDAFIQRCDDILCICEGRIQFVLVETLRLKTACCINFKVAAAKYS